MRIEASTAAGKTAGTGGNGGCVCDALEECLNLERCVARSVVVTGGYAIDATEATRSQYEAWLKTAPGVANQVEYCSWNTSFVPDADCMSAQACKGQDCGRHPQVCVDWCDAYRYCASSGKRLCGKIAGGANDFNDYADATRSQWYNACASGGQNEYAYGGGYEAQTCNGYDNGVTGCMGGACTTVEVGSLEGCSSQVGGYAAAYDLSGNVWEWEDSCSDVSGSTDGCRLRGGSFLGTDCLRCNGGSLVGSRAAVFGVAGFRCCSM
jgi:formylglycine-generating enzyme required for sulfatase activity